jgi:mannose-6-phosphate isomerase
VLPGDGARLLLCVEGTVTLRGQAGGTLKVTRGESCFLSAADAAVTATGPGVAFFAACGLNQ